MVFGKTQPSAAGKVQRGKRVNSQCGVADVVRKTTEVAQEVGTDVAIMILEN